MIPSAGGIIPPTVGKNMKTKNIILLTLLSLIPATTILAMERDNSDDDYKKKTVKAEQPSVENKLLRECLFLISILSTPAFKIRKDDFSALKRNVERYLFDMTKKRISLKKLTDKELLNVIEKLAIKCAKKLPDIDSEFISRNRGKETSGL